MKKEEIQEIVEELDSSYKKLVLLTSGWKRRCQRDELTKDEIATERPAIWDMDEAMDALRDATNLLEEAVSLLEENESKK